MKQGLTEMVFILDRSGSMGGLENDTIGGYNSLIEKQKGEAGEAIITTVLFDDRYEIVHDRVPLTFVSGLSSREYFVRGSTALLDAIGRSIQHIIQHRRRAPQDRQPERTVFVITTDGAENASWKYSADRIKTMIEYQQQNYHWEFLFLGANMDAVAAASQVGIASDRAVQYHADAEGTALNYAVIGDAISQIRQSNRLDADWMDRVVEDHRTRTKRS